jgi:nicotinamide-nucleotide amidase
MARADQPSAIILTVGTELTEGITQDSHVRFLAAGLTGLGFAVRRAGALPDEEQRLRAEIDRAAAEAALVIVTGGLGPTSDDLTREAVAALAGVPLEFHPEAWERIRARFAGGAAGGRPIPEANRKQATAPAGFSLLPNPNGTAPGFSGGLGKSFLVALPGPPREMRPMFDDEVVPLLRERFELGASAGVLWGSAFMVSESALEEALRASRAAGVGWRDRPCFPRWPLAWAPRGSAKGRCARPACCCGRWRLPG